MRAALCVMLSIFISVASPAAALSLPPGAQISNMIDKIILHWSDKANFRASIIINSAHRRRVVSFDIYNSNSVQSPIYRNNCVASPADEAISCDLSMIDRMINDFKLVEFSAVEASREPEARKFFRSNILFWVLSHEVSHILLNHGLSMYDDDDTLDNMFNVSKQKEELEADRRSARIIEGAKKKLGGAFSTVLTIANALERRAVCPDTFPKVCSNMPAGVGLIYNYTEDRVRMKLKMDGSHPDFIVRFLRILYILGRDRHISGLDHIALRAVQQIQIETSPGEWKYLADVFVRG